MIARLFLIPIALVAFAASANPIEFRAEYRGDFVGLPVQAKAVRELTRMDNGHYRLTSSAEALFVSITESSEFTYEDERWLPDSYHYQRQGLGKNKNEQHFFDWPEMTMNYRDTVVAAEPGALDKLSYQLKLRADVMKALASDDNNVELSYLIADEEKFKQYRFRIIGEEVLATPLGEINTVRVDRIRETSERQTSFWLAIDYEFLLVRLKQLETRNRGFELNLQAATIAGTPLTKSSVE